MAVTETDWAAVAASPTSGGELDQRRVVLARIAVIGAILGVWQLVVTVGLVDAFWISTPSLIVQELWQLVASGNLVGDVAITIYEALIAFVVSSALLRSPAGALAVLGRGAGAAGAGAQ